MSLRAFHIFFIVVSILLSAFLGKWSYSQYQQTQNTQMLGLAVFCALSFIGLAIYSIKFRNKTKKLLMIAIAFLVSQGLTTKALACAVCFNPENESVRTSVNSAIGFLIALTALVLGGLTYFVLKIIKNDKEANHSQ